MAKTLSLGTLFKGEIDASFRNTINELRKMLSTLNGAIGGVKDAADKHRAAMTSMGSDLTDYQLACGRAMGVSKKFHDALVEGAERFGAKQGSALKNLERGLLKTESAIQRQAVTMTNAGQEGKKWADSTDRLSTLLDYQAGKIKFVKSGIETVTTAQKDLSKYTRQSGSDLTEFQLAMGKATNQSARYRQALAEGATIYGKQGSGLQFLVNNLNRTETAIQATAARMNVAGNDSAAWAAGVNRLSLMQDELAGRLRFTKNGIENLTEAQQALIDRGGRSIGVMERFGNTLKSMAYWGLAATAIYGTIRAIRDGISEVMEFDQALKNLQAITSATDGEVKVMGTTIKELARDTKYSAREIADGMVIIGQAGFSASESIDTMKSVAILATGTLSSMKDTTDLLTTTIRAFELKASDSGRVADVMATAINKSKLDVEKLRVAFSYLAPVASQAGISLEESAVATMLLADNGLRASTIGTAFRQVLARLISPTSDLQAKFNALGADMSKLDPSTNTLKSVLEELARVAPTATEAFSLFGLRGAPAVTVLTRAMKDGAKQFDEYYEKVFEVGSAQAMADKQMEGLANKAKNLMNSIHLLSIAVGEGGLGSTLGLVIDVLRGAVKGTTALASTISGQLVIAMVSAAAASRLLFWAMYAVHIPAAIAAIRSYITSFSIMSMTVTQVGAAITGMASSFVGWISITSNWLMIAAALTGAFAYWIKTQKEMRAELQTNLIQHTSTIEKLEEYRTKLASLNPDSREYSATLKRLAQDHQELAPQIDIVTGKWYDQLKGLKILDEYIEQKHLKRMQDQIDLALDIAKTYNQALSAENTTEIFPLGPDDSAKEFRDLKMSIVSLLPKLKELGITGASTSKEIADAFTTIYPKMDASTVNIRALVEATKSLFDDQANAIIEAKRKQAEEAAKIATGERRAVVDIYDGLYGDLDGKRRAESEKIRTRLEKNLKTLEESSEEEFKSIKGYEAEKLKLQSEAVEELAKIRWKDVGTTEDVNKEVLSAIIRLIQSTRNQYHNEIKEEDEKYKKKLELAKGSNKDVQRIIDAHNILIAQKEAHHQEAILAQISWYYENVAKYHKEGMDRVKEEVERSQQEMNKLKGYGTYDLSQDFIESGGPASLPKPAQLKPYTDSEIKTGQERIMLDISKRLEKIVENSSKYVRSLWANISEEEKSAFVDILIELDSNLQKIQGTTDTSANKLKKMRDAFGAAMVSFSETQREINKTQTPLQKSMEKTAEAMRSIDMSHMTDKIQKERVSAEQDLEKMKIAIEEFKKQVEIAVQSETPVKKDVLGMFRLDYDPTGVDPTQKIKDQMQIFKTLDDAYQEYKVKRTQEMEDRISKIRSQKEKERLSAQEHSLNYQIKAMSEALENEIDYEKKAHLNFWKDYLQAFKDAEDEKENQTKEGADKSLDIEGIKNERIKQAWLKLQDDLVKAKERADNKIYKEASKKADAEAASLEATYQIQRLESQRNAVSKEQMLQIDIEYYNRKFEKAWAHYQAVAALEGGDEKKRQEHLARAAKEAEQAWMQRYNAEKEYYEKTHKYDEQKWRAGEISSAQYFEHLKMLRKYDIIDEEEYINKTVALNGGLWDNIKRGWQQAKREAKSFGEVVQALAKEFPDKFSSGMSSAIMDMIEGTKTAKEAMRDFFSSMIRWIMEAILKQQILNLLMGEAGGGGGGGLGGGIVGVVGNLLGGLFGGGYNTGGFTSAGGVSWNPSMNLPFHHAGGIIGNRSPLSKLVPLSVFKNAIYAHKGFNVLAADEVPIVAKKNERIYTPEQDAARTKPSNVNFKFEFVNKTSNANMKVVEGPTRKQGNSYVKTAWLYELKNDKNFRNQAKGILGVSR